MSRRDYGTGTLTARGTSRPAGVSVALVVAVQAMIRTLAQHNEKATLIEIRFTPDALPVLADDLPSLWAIERLFGVDVDYPETPAKESMPPRTVSVEVFGDDTRSAVTVALYHTISAECLRDTIKVPLP